MTAHQARARLNALLDEYSPQCLWSLQVHYYFATDPERRRVLDYIQGYGDRTAFVRAASLRRCLSTSPGEPTAATGS